jgi:hypothetical protein
LADFLKKIHFLECSQIILVFLNFSRLFTRNLKFSQKLFSFRKSVPFTHYIVVSSVEGEAWCAVTGLFSCYEDCQPNTNLVFVKAGVLTLNQLKTNMLVFSHGGIEPGILNPHVMGRQLTHFAPATVSDQICDEDVLNQCCILRTPCAEFSKENSSLYHSMDLTELNIETRLSAQAQIQVASLPQRITQFMQCKDQETILHYFL